MSIGISPKQHQPRTADKQTVMRAQGQFFNGTQLVVLVVVLEVVAICGPCADAAAAATPHFSWPPNSHNDGASSSGCCHAGTHVCDDNDEDDDEDIPLRLFVAHCRPGLAVKTSRSSSSSSIFRRKANVVAVSLRGGGGNTQSRATTTAAAASRCRRSNSLPTTVTTSVTAAADGSPAGTLTSNRAVINLVKSIVGAAVFGLPAGVAASFGHRAAPSKTAILPALLILVTIGTWAAYGFDNIGTVCRVSGATSYTQAWSRTVGTKSSWMPATACFMVTVCTVLTYSVILADTIPAIVESTMASCLIVSTSTTVQWWSMGRTSALLSVTLLIVYPLCRLQSLAALAPFSFLGILGMLFTGLCMAIRYLSGAYAPHGHFAMQVAPHLYEPKLCAAALPVSSFPNHCFLVHSL
jgi:Transmembrane amino acid transporter protein